MLRKSIAPMVLAGFAAFSTAAMAASTTKTGDVRSTDAAKHQLTLSSGETFEVKSGIKLDGIKAGDKVTVTYDMKDGKMWASKVSHTK